MTRAPWTLHRARTFASVCIAVSWLSLLVLLNEASGGMFRAAILFAVPVCLVAWRSLTASFAIAALAVVSAWIGGAFPPVGSTESQADMAMLAFIRLSCVSVATAVWSRVVRRRHELD
jgi:hypothetical protein